jgi:hypothetical protein
MATSGTITIPDDAWSGTYPDNDPQSRMHVSVVLNGALLNLTAFRIKARWSELHGLQEPDHEAHLEEYHRWCSAAGQGEPFEEMSIMGRQYVVFGSPGS